MKAKEAHDLIGLRMADVGDECEVIIGLRDNRFPDVILCFDIESIEIKRSNNLGTRIMIHADWGKISREINTMMKRDRSKDFVMAMRSFFGGQNG